MLEKADAIRAAVEQPFAQVALQSASERKFPVGPTSARKLGYHPQQIDARPPSVTEPFCGVGDPLGLGEAPDEVSGTWLPRPCLWRTPARPGTLSGVKQPLATLARNQDHERAEPDR